MFWLHHHQEGGAIRTGGCAFLALALLLAAMAAAGAADIRVLPERSAGLRTVSIDGPILRQDIRGFERAIFRARAATVELSSVGGDPAAALAIARFVRQRGFQTVVPPGAVCAGPCVLVWLAGTTRSVHRRGTLRFHLDVGLHGAMPRNADLVAIEKAIHLEFRHSMDVAWLLTRSPPGAARDLDPEMARELGLEVVWLSGAGPGWAEPLRTPEPRSATAAARAAGKEAVVLVGDLMRWIRLDRPLTDGIIAQFYGERLRYHGADISRHDLMMLQRVYRRRGPTERLVMAGEPEAACSRTGEQCTVTLTANLHGERDRWGQSADAVFAYRFVVVRGGRRMRIVEEERRLVGRDPYRPEPPEAQLTRRIQAELWRLNCRHGPIDGWWDFSTAHGLARFHRANGTRLLEDGPTRRDLGLMEANPAPICLR